LLEKTNKLEIGEKKMKEGRSKKFQKKPNAFPSTSREAQ
jgi:hypothetical protein